jgi:hypothetical protein
VAYYAAGDSTPKGLPFDEEPEIEAEPGDLDRAALDQRGQIVAGPQTNTGGGAYVGGNVYTGGGKFVGRDDYSSAVTQQGASLEALRALVAELGLLLRRADLRGDAAEIIATDFKVIEQQAASEAPSGVIVKSKLSSVLEALKAVAGTSGDLEKIISLGRSLAKMAMAVFP